MYAASADNENANPKDTIFTIKDTKLHVSVVTWSAKDSQKLSKLFNKRFERLIYWKKNKVNSETKKTTSKYWYFLESNFVGVNRWLIYLNRNNYIKRYDARKYYLPKAINKIVT